MNLARLRAAFAVLRGERPTGLSNVDRFGGGRGWMTLYGAGTPGNFQTDELPSWDTSLSFYAVYACITQIASDIAKLELQLRQKTRANIWEPTLDPDLSPLLRKPNHFQTTQQFIESWIISKLSRGNFYGLKQRDQRGKVVRVYPLDPDRCTPMVAADGSVFYDLRSDDLAKLPADVLAPASEIIHDRAECLFHPLVGIAPLYASGLATQQGLKIQGNSAKFFANMSRPSGVLTAPGEIHNDTADRLKKQWEENFSGDNMGKVAVLGDGLAYAPMAFTPLDAQLVEQLKLSGEQVCSTFHVPAFMVGIGPMPGLDNVQALTQWYYSQCLQKLIESAERLMDDGFELEPNRYRIEFNLDDLLRMDGKTLSEVEGNKVQRGIASPNEARFKFNLPPVPGGESPYLQQQNFSLAALAKRDAQDNPFAPAKPPEPPASPPAPPEDDEDEDDQTDKALHLLFRRAPETMTHA